jgi:hypothetical protein
MRMQIRTRTSLPLTLSALLAAGCAASSGTGSIAGDGDVGGELPDGAGGLDDTLTPPGDDTDPGGGDGQDGGDDLVDTVAPDAADADDPGRDADPGEAGGEDTGPDTATEPTGDAALPPDAEEDAPAVTCGGLRCADGAVCVLAQCVAVTGRCDEGAPCRGDARCCGTLCEDEGLCVAWGDGRTNQECEARVEIGLFEPDIQCEWAGPPEGDAWPDHVNVLSTPMVATLPYGAAYGANVVFVSYNFTDGGAQSGIGNDARYYGVIRIIDGERCTQIETIDDPEHRIIASSSLAIGDLDGDGVPEIVAQRAISGMVAFRWNADARRYVRWWVSTDTQISGETRWDGPALHDLDDDGFPEVISWGEVYDGRTGARLNPGQRVAPAGGSGTLSVVADVDGDGRVNLVTGPVFAWDTETGRWVAAHTGAPAGFIALGDFGTDSAEGFDRSTRDGVAEIVSVAGNRAVLATLAGRILLDVRVLLGGGPPMVGDFDNDGRAEFASAGGSELVVFDPDCTGAGDGCRQEGVRWLQPSQDQSSRVTGASIFDFDEDGQAEVVYADECYTRMYDGATGTVLYSSYRTSCTWYENPVVADVDGDGNSEIVVGSNTNCSVVCPALDPIHPGLRCDTSADCPGELPCAGGLCRCTGEDPCTEDTRCAPSLAPADPDGAVCRAFRPAGAARRGVRVLRDRLDRWASSRPVWNQHTYSITSIGDDLRVPRTSAWMQSFALDGPNSYRANAQGSVGSSFVPDLTVRHGSIACTAVGGGDVLEATVCNRGWRAVGASLPIRFESMDGTLLCTAFTERALPAATCQPVQCTATTAEAGGRVRVIANRDGDGRPTTLECDDDNNVLEADVVGCGGV